MVDQHDRVALDDVALAGIDVPALGAASGGAADLVAHTSGAAPAVDIALLGTSSADVVAAGLVAHHIHDGKIASAFGI